MAAVAGEGKSTFLKEFLENNPGANEDAVNAAWKEAGHEGTISISLISKIRSGLGLTSKGRSRPTVTQSSVTSRQAVAIHGQAGPKKADRRTPAKPNGRHVSGSLERPDNPQTADGDLTRVLIKLEGEIDDMIHEIKGAGGLPEFEETLRKARRILARSHRE